MRYTKIQIEAYINKTYPEPYKTQALNNMGLYLTDGIIDFPIIEDYEPDILTAIFIWIDTTEGLDHWEDFHDKLTADYNNRPESPKQEETH